MAISMGLDTRRRTAVTTATGLPRYARNDKVDTREATPRLTRFGSRVTLSGRFRPQLLNNRFPGIGRQQTNSGLMGKAVKVRRGCATVSGKPYGYRRRHHNQAVANPESPGRESGILPDVLLELYSAPNRVVPLRHPLTGQNGLVPTPPTRWHPDPGEPVAPGFSHCITHSKSHEHCQHRN